MTRTVVAGAHGFFGSTVVRILRAEGHAPLIASRRSGGDLLLDVESRTSIHQAIRPGDVIVDATAPFQARTATLVDEAIAIGADIVDLSDSFAYARLVSMRDAAARDRGVRILNACSAVSVWSAFAIERSGIPNPIGIHGFLAPATRRTAHPGVAASLLASVGSSISILHAGEIQYRRGWGETREFRAIQRRGRAMEMADAFTLPRCYPTLRDVDFWVDPNTRGAGALLGVVARAPVLAPLARRLARYGAPLARLTGSAQGLLAYEIEGSSGERSTVVFSGPESYLLAAIPAALAAIRLASGLPCRAGVVPVNQHVDPETLAAALVRYDIVMDRRSDERRLQELNPQ